MPPRPKSSIQRPSMGPLIALTNSTQDLITHFQSSLTASSAAALTKTSSPPSHQNGAPTTPSNQQQPDLLAVIKATTTLLRSHTTTLSLLLLTPPLTPSALMSKIGDVSSGALAGMVAAATSPASPSIASYNQLPEVMHAEIRAQVRRLLTSWSDVLTLIQRFASRREREKKDDGPSEAEKQEVLAATGVVWEACDGLVKVCEEGVVGLVVRKAEEWRAVLMDAVEELKEWGEDVDDEGSDKEREGEGEAHRSAEKDEGNDHGGFDTDDEDAIFGAANRLGKGDKDLKALLDRSVKSLKMVGMLYQALIKRRLKTYPRGGSGSTSTTIPNETTTSGTSAEAPPSERLDNLLLILKSIPDTVDDLASSFYDLEEQEATRMLEKCCREATSAIDTVKRNWSHQDDEFTTWSGKWVEALQAV